MSGTLTVHQWVGLLSGTGALVWQSDDGTDVVYVDDATNPTFRLVLTREEPDGDSAISFELTNPAGTVTFAAADYAVSLTALELELGQHGVAGASAVLTAGLTDIVLAEHATADLATIASGLSLTGNDEGTAFWVTQSATVDAGEGDDTINAGPVPDYATIHGGDGDDTLSFAQAAGRATLEEEWDLVDFLDGPNFLAEWTFDGIEFFGGSEYDDTFHTAGRGSSFEGGKGADYFEKLGSGTERDIVDYSGEDGDDGIVVNFGDYLGPDEIEELHSYLAAALVAGLHGAPDMAGFNNVRDTHGDYDSVFSGFTIVGTSRADFFYGSWDADSFEGGGGDDNFFGGGGDDTIDGGEGPDALFFSGAMIDISYSDGVFTIESEDGGIDTVRNVETFWFGEVEIDASTYRLAFDDANAADELVEAGADGPGDDAAGGNVLDNDKPQGSPSVVRVGAGGIADTDVDGDGVVVNGTYGVLTITSDGTWTYELDNARAATNSLADGVTAPDVFTYRFSNGNGFDTAKLTIAIVGSNDAPVAGDDMLTGSHLEDAAIVVPSAVLLANDGDVDGQTLTVASVAGAQHGAVSLVSGNVLFTPDANYSGAASFTYKVSDGTLEGNWATVSFTITAQNDEPVTDDMRIAVSQGHSYVFTATDVPFSDPDAGDTRQGIVLVSLPTHGVLKLGSATVSAGQLLTDAQIGQLTYVAPTNVSGEGADTFEFKVFDGAATSAAKAITFDIAAGNSAPVANNDGLFVGPYLEDMAISIAAITLTANDVDPDTGQTLSIVSVSDAQHGSVALVSGNVVFTPDANYAGPASFTYVVSDGALTSNAASVTLSLIPVPDAPAASDRQVTIAEDGSYTFSSADFAFSDPDAGDVLRSVKIASLPGSGTLTLGGVPVAPGQSIAVASVSQLSFTPSANAHGSPLSSFAFTVSDGTLDSAAKTFSINVTAGNDTPVAVNDAGFATAEDTPITFIASVLLGNDGDADGDSLAIASVASGAGGTAVLNLDGTVTFTPLPNFSGAASFSYRAKDGSGALSGVAVASLTVTPVNDAPAFTRGVGVGPSAALAFLEGTSEVYAIAASDIDSATLTYSLEGEDAGDFVISGSTLLFKAASDFEAPADSDGNNIYRVAVVVSDGVLTDRQELVISVLDATGNTVVGTKKADTVDLMHKVGLLGATDEADLIKGQAGKDTIGAAAGDDTVQGGSGKDELDGGAGFDLADYSDKTASVTATLSGSSDARVRVGGTNEDTIRNFEGVVGGRAADKLTGDAGANLLSGGGGNDMLSGKAGDDTLTGGKGNDRFVFDGKIKFGSVDVITDFKHNKDVIVLDDKIAKAIGSSLSAGEFYAKAHANAAHDADDRIIYNRTTGDIFYDADGDKAGGKDAILFATLSTHPALDAGDFLIV